MNIGFNIDFDNFEKLVPLHTKDSYLDRIKHSDLLKKFECDKKREVMDIIFKQEAVFDFYFKKQELIAQSILDYCYMSKMIGRKLDYIDVDYSYNKIRAKDSSFNKYYVVGSFNENKSRYEVCSILKLRKAAKKVSWSLNGQAMEGCSEVYHKSTDKDAGNRNPAVVCGLSEHIDRFTSLLIK